MKIPAMLAGGLVYPVQERIFGRPTFGHLAALEKSQWLTRECIESLQIEKLRALLVVAHASH